AHGLAVVGQCDEVFEEVHPSLDQQATFVIALIDEERVGGVSLELSEVRHLRELVYACRATDGITIGIAVPDEAFNEMVRICRGVRGLTPGDGRSRAAQEPRSGECRRYGLEVIVRSPPVRKCRQTVPGPQGVDPRIKRPSPHPSFARERNELARAPD